MTADARRRAEEALANFERFVFIGGPAHPDKPYHDAGVNLATALRALLAAGPEAVCTPGCACGAPHEPDDEDPCACPCHEPDGTPASSDAAVREAAEVVRTILTAHDARLSESGALTYGPPSEGTGFVAAIQWLRRYDAARGGE